jgi:hypothetical protein
MVGPAKKMRERQKYLEQLKEEGPTAMPQKKFYRQRAHANPFSDHFLA